MNIRDTLNKDYGEIATAGNKYPKAEFISSGNYKFDAVTGGGFARGHMTEIVGEEGTGKTALCLQAIAEAQRNGMVCYFVDAEGRLNRERAEALGVDLAKLTIIIPKYGEQACDAMRDIIESGEVDLLVLDSLPALTSKTKLDKTEGGGPIGSHARMWGEFLTKIIAGFSQRKTAFVVINQVRKNLVGLMNPYAPGAKDPYSFPGGTAQKFYASNRVFLKKMEQGTELGYKIKFRTLKSSFTRPFLEAESFFDWEKGFSNETDILELAIDKGIITRDGAGYFFEGEKISHGQKKMRELMQTEFGEKIAALLS